MANPNRTMRAVALHLLLAAQPALAAHPVSIAKAEPVSGAVHLTLTAEASDAAAHDEAVPRPGRAYHLSIQLPSGVTPALPIGSFVTVTLPTVHHNTAPAKIKSISKTRVELVLENQTQLLDGQRLKVTLPLKSAHLYQIPFQAVYSPRGITTEVFVLSPEQRAHRIPVVPIKVLPGGKIIVSSDRLNGASIVIQGTDNLISGDGVRVVEQKGAASL
ncbi:MAG: hypothetical protein HYV14_15875 [Elusimicrobia bacterium]|nr:hypothetical protein [Elusimicrobiota bacterium]